VVDAAAASPDDPTLGPFSEPEDACPDLLRGYDDASHTACRRLRKLERAAGPFDRASVVEVESAENPTVHQYALAVGASGQWYVSQPYPDTGIEGGMESLGVWLVGDPRIDTSASHDGGTAAIASLSLREKHCRWKKWMQGPGGVGTLAPAPARCFVLPRDAPRSPAMACAWGPGGRPVCGRGVLDRVNATP
jgi:hypothetical protein